MKRILTTVALLFAFGLAGCSEPGSNTRGVYMLIDTSGTYTRELKKAQQIINAILSSLEPGDSFAVARIDTASFSERDIIAKMTFNDRPSKANQQKREFRKLIDTFVKNAKPAGYTDITGGILQALEYLNEKNPGVRTILVFSDLKEDLKKGYIRDIPLEMNGTNVVALNVTKLHSDNIDPREYMARLLSWQGRIEEGGGSWRVINDLDRLERLFATDG